MMTDASRAALALPSPAPLPVPPGFVDELARFGVTLTDEQLAQLGDYLARLLAMNEQMNLTAVTDGDGRFTFTGLRAGSYTLSEEQPEGLVSTFNTAGNAGGTVLDDVISNIAIGSGFQADGYFFGEQFSGG